MHLAAISVRSAAGSVPSDRSTRLSQLRARGRGAAEAPRAGGVQRVPPAGGGAAERREGAPQGAHVLSQGIKRQRVDVIVIISR